MKSQSNLTSRQPALIRSIVLLGVTILLATSCSRGAQNSIGKATDNANKLIKSETPKVWGSKNTSAAHVDDEDEAEKSQRY